MTRNEVIVAIQAREGGHSHRPHGSQVDQTWDRLGVRVRKGKEMDNSSQGQMNVADIQ